MASGAGAIAGLYGAIAVGFFAAVFGGTPAQVSGPTGPMTVVMAVIVTRYAHNIGEAFAIVFLGGVIQVLLGVIRVGRYVSYTPYSVVSGFMSGVGIIIILIQTLPFFGLPTANGGPVGTIRAWPTIVGSANTDALVIALVSLAVAVFWPVRLRAYLPPPLAALIAGTALAVLWLKGAPVIGEVPTGLPALHLPTFPLGDLPDVLQAALVLGLLGSVDSLLTSLVANSITRTRHRSDRELIGQGLGNMAAGLIGGLPGAGATMRTVVNVRAGGRTPLSGALHALVLLALVLGLAPLAEQVPHAALAGILLKVGWDIIDWGYLKRIARAPREKVVVMLITMGLTVFVDLITAVAVGLILAGFVTSRWMEREQMKGVTRVAMADAGTTPLSSEEQNLLNAAAGAVELVMFRGTFSYASARQLTNALGGTSEAPRAIILDFTEAAHIDTSAALAVEELIVNARHGGSEVFVAGLSGPARETLVALDVLARLPGGHVLENRAEAISVALANSGQTLRA